MIREVAIFITRECNLECQFCQVRKIRRTRTLNVDQWHEVFKKVKELNPELVVVYGGEPLLRQDILEILDRLHEVKLPYTLISNSTLLDENLAKRLVNHGLNSFTASIDYPQGMDDLRSKQSWRALNLMKDLGVEDVTGNMIIYRKNYKYIPSLIDALDKLDIWSILGLCQFPRDENDNVFSYRCWDSENVFKDEDIKGLKDIAGRVMSMGKEGFLIHNIPQYIKLIPYYAKPDNRFKWHCSRPCYLTIDEDGTLMACPDFRGTVERFDILNFDLVGYENIWRSDVSQCPGCFFSHQFQAELGGIIKHG